VVFIYITVAALLRIKLTASLPYLTG